MTRAKQWRLWIAGWAVLAAIAAQAQEGLRLESFNYPFPVQQFEIASQGTSLEMSYMDLAPSNGSHGVIVLLHGKNFSGAYWGQTAWSLSQLGYRVIVPDQIGFGKSSKPEHYQYSFQQLAANTHALLAMLGVTNATLLGHSMGGMLATRYGLMYPEATKSLILLDPLGLEDWQAKGVPYEPVDDAYKKELKQTAAKLQDYEKENYYHGTWRPSYEVWVGMMDEFYRSTNYALMAWNQALTSDMIFTQPVCHEFGDLKMPVLLIVGEKDRTAIGKDLVAAEKKAELGKYPELGRKAVAAMKRGKFVEITGAGHLPQIEAFADFIAPVKEFLKKEANPVNTRTNVPTK